VKSCSVLKTIQWTFLLLNEYQYGVAGSHWPGMLYRALYRVDSLSVLHPPGRGPYFCGLQLPYIEISVGVE